MRQASDMRPRFSLPFSPAALRRLLEIIQINFLLPRKASEFIQQKFKEDLNRNSHFLELIRLAVVETWRFRVIDEIIDK
jgi:hypothetical protein